MSSNVAAWAAPAAADVEVIPIGKINEAYDRMLRSDVRYRFVIDLASLSEPRP